jgi:hypothetical protein
VYLILSDLLDYNAYTIATIAYNSSIELLILSFELAFTENWSLDLIHSEQWSEDSQRHSGKA